jgi:hypothetical protein
MPGTVRADQAERTGELGRTGVAAFLLRQWHKVHHAVGLARTPAADAAFGLVVESWTGFTGDGHHRSAVSEDGFPAELSVSWRAGVTEVRVLLEQHGQNAFESQEAGRALTGRLPGADLRRCRAVEDLFVVPRPVEGAPTVWHSLAHNGSLHHKVYYNAQVHGRSAAAQVVGEAMERLGLRDAWRPVAARCTDLAERGHHVEFFALDLSARADARVKVYFRHGAADRAELGTVAAFAAGHSPLAFERAASGLCATTGTVRDEPLTCLAFCSGAGGPAEANVYFRTSDDGPWQNRAVLGIMREAGLPAREYRALRAAYADGAGEGFGARLELVSHRTSAGGAEEIGVYVRYPR